MQTDRFEFPTSKGPTAAWFAAPDGWSSGPAVVVVQEWWGLNDNIESITRRLAEEGFAALAPDLYYGKQATEPDDAEKLMMALDEGLALENLRAAVGWLIDRGASAVGATGFCMGGGLVWELAFTEDRVGAAVPFYGWSEPKARKLLAPVQAHFAGVDDYPWDELAEARSAVASRAWSEFHWYEFSHHAFMNDTRPAFDADAAALAWHRMVEFFHERLVMS